MTSSTVYPHRRFTDIQKMLGQHSEIIYRQLPEAAGLFPVPERRDCFILMLFEDGKGVNVIDHADHKVAPLQMHLCFPGQVHHWHLDKTTSGHIMILSEDMYDTLASYFKFPISFYKKKPQAPLTRDIFNTLVHEIQYIQAELYTVHRLLAVVYSRIRIISLVIERAVYQASENPIGLDSRPVLEQFQSLIRTHFEKHRAVQFYADRLFITANYLNILCRRHYGKSSADLINSEVIREIKLLLTTSSKSIKEIAGRLHFNEVSYFSTFFKRYTGLTPMQYRNRFKR
ncbi:helix-turn-helix domain-containing protein [Niabella drilacis]|uniref:Transcriptional regulator, AraC family n=1 Tax=Niabella drilacis (strain DSM 25811 / CCM 8410 / CCUG 62505 / LMG 26954 / E90) TaxID=1285928 RepID=A0A1G6WWX9_NIADE|nr:AraC family transcriptional regulator [Niabella drilacis]SDD70314.1 transcriptional regulator, AraC family [Niabella drilacis]